MSEHGYETGRLNLPFVGHCTFGKQPACLDWERIDADVAVLGAPFDMGTQYRAGARFGPRAIREASTLFSFGHGGAYDFEDDVTYLPADKVRLVDVGDADMIHTDTIKSHDNIELGVRKILAAGALPVVLGGDHSVHIPCIRAYDDQPPVHIIHIDAHLDFVDERHGVRYGHGNPLRRASEMKHVTGFTQLGIRNVSSSNRDDYEAARKAGSDILSVRDVRRRRAKAGSPSERAMTTAGTRGARSIVPRSGDFSPTPRPARSIRWSSTRWTVSPARSRTSRRSSKS